MAYGPGAHVHQIIAASSTIVNHGKISAALLGIEHLDAEFTRAALDEYSHAIQRVCREGIAAQSVTGIDRFSGDKSIGENLADRKGGAKTGSCKGHILQRRIERFGGGDTELACRIGAAAVAGSHVDVFIRRVVAGAVTGAGIAVGHANENARIGNVDQGLVERVEFAAQTAGAAAPRIVEHFGAVHGDIFQCGDAFGGVE